MDYISGFITHIVNNGIVPKSTKDILPTTAFRRIQQNSDKGGKRSISYWLRIEHDFSYGYAHDFKTGISAKFSSYNDDPGLTRADIARIKTILKERQIEQDRITAERHAKISQRAAIKWSTALPDGHSPYLDAKKLTGLSSARILADGCIMVPIFDHEQMVSWQTIAPDGKKRFPFGGKKQGCWHVIGQIDPTKPIIICEGWATGRSISESLNIGVVVAFDAGNLLHVARAIRKIHKNTQIIIAGDNDKSQTGQKAAHAVQQKVSNCTAIICPKVGCDFNDLSPDEVKASFGFQEGDGGELTPSGLQPLKRLPAAADWMENILRDSKGFMIGTSMQNILLYCINHDDFKGIFAYDEFKQCVLINKCPPWAEEEQFKVRMISDNDITMTCGYLERHGLVPSYEKAFRAINVAAHVNKFHSARQYISSLEWDGNERLEVFFKKIGCEKEHPDYLAFTFKKWMTAAVKRIMEPGCKFDHVLILESQEQGFYKSSALKALSTFNGEEYHTESFGINDIGKDYSTLKLQGVMFVELSELSGFNKKDDESIRQWITQTVDEVRLPYERTISKFLRKFVLCATTNNYDYLKDPSGNRRYWPVTICRPIDIEYINSVKEQLWAEALHLYQNNIYIGPTKEENDLADFERSKRLQADAWDDIVMDAVLKMELDEFRVSDVLRKMDLKTHEKNEKAIRRISAILKANGYSNNPVWDKKNRKNVRLWSK